MMDERGIEPKRDAGSRVSRRTFALGAVGACAVIGLGGVKYLPLSLIHISVSFCGVCHRLRST